MESTERRQEADSTASPAIPERCLFCQVEMQPARRKGITKLFCCDRHRAAYRTKVIQSNLAQVQKAIGEARDVIAEWEALVARLDGAWQLLAKALEHGRPRAAHSDTQSERTGTNDLTGPGQS